MKKLTADILREELHYEPSTGIFTRRKDKRGGAKIGDVADYCNVKGYITIGVLGRYYRAHRLAWLYVYGYWPTNMIDHINRIKQDNRIENLRDVSQSINGRNAKIYSVNISGINGVHWCKRDSRWIVRAAKNGKRITLGSFKDLFEACCTRKTWDAANPLEVQ